MKKTGRAGFQRSRLLMDAPKMPCMADPEFSKKELCVESDELRVPYNSQGRQTKREESERYFVTECGKEKAGLCYGSEFLLWDDEKYEREIVERKNRLGTN